MQQRFIGFVLCIPLVVWAIIRIVWYVSFTIHCGGHMERAGSANSIDLARQEMETIVKYAEKNDLTSGYTSVFWNSPGEDVGFWYKNMKASLEELQKVKPTASDLEKSNILIKLRETVTHHTSSGQEITIPDSLYVFPCNVLMAWFGIGSLLVACVGALMFTTAD